MKWYLWTIIPAMMLFTLLFFLAEHMRYSFEEWFVGNFLIACLISFIYVSEFVYTKINKDKY